MYNVSTQPTHNFVIREQVQVNETVTVTDYSRLAKIKGRSLVISTIDASGIWVRLPKATSPETLPRHKPAKKYTICFA